MKNLINNTLDECVNSLVAGDSLTAFSCKNDLENMHLPDIILYDLWQQIVREAIERTDEAYIMDKIRTLTLLQQKQQSVVH